MQTLPGALWGCAGPWCHLLRQQACLQHAQQDLGAYGELKVGFSPPFFFQNLFSIRDWKKEIGKKKEKKKVHKTNPSKQNSLERSRPMEPGLLLLKEHQEGPCPKQSPAALTLPHVWGTSPALLLNPCPRHRQHLVVS